jgi:hypothetical protein
MKIERLPITCPICGQKNEFPMENLREGEIITCPVCKVTLTLHGHMWQEIQSEIQRLEAEAE